MNRLWLLGCSCRSELLGLVALAGLLAACEHPGLGRRYGDQTGGNPGVYAPPDGTCPSTCSTPPGSFLPYEGWAAPSDQLRAGIVGVWQICSGAYSVFLWAPADTIGVEFAPPAAIDAAYPEGNMFFLTAGASGPVRGAGFEYQQTYSVNGMALYCHGSYNSGNGWWIKYSPCPRQLQIKFDYSGLKRNATLVPF